MLTGAHAAATWTMVGVIWFVQLVHYPLFDAVSPHGFPAYQSANIRLTAWMVGLPMVVELVTAARLARIRLDAASWAGLALLAVVWLSTGLLQYPANLSLAAAFDPALHERLVLTNWIRTVAWTARGLLALRLLRS